LRTDWPDCQSFSSETSDRAAGINEPAALSATAHYSEAVCLSRRFRDGLRNTE